MKTHENSLNPYQEKHCLAFYGLQKEYTMLLLSKYYFHTDQKEAELVQMTHCSDGWTTLEFHFEAERFETHHFDEFSPIKHRKVKRERMFNLCL